MEKELLIATNGFHGALPAVEYGAWLAANLKVRATLLGVAETLSPAAIDDRHPLEDVFARAVELFRQYGAEYRLEVEKGSAEEVVPQKARSGNYIVTLGPLGRPPLRRMLVGRSIRRLMEQIEQPILYVPRLKLPLKKLLICVGGLGYEVTAEHLAMRIAMRSRAKITLLHVVPPMDLEYPTAKIVRENRERLVDTDTPVGRSLRKALQIANRDGLNASVKTREGVPLEEIVAEAREGEYDLLCMGSAFSSHSLRQMYAPNVAAEVAEAAPCPTLSARYSGEA